MGHVRISRAMMAVAGGLGLGIVSSGVAEAAVYSDSVAFSGPVNPGPTPTSFTFSSTQCSIRSDSEATNFTCTISGTLTKTATGYSGTSTTTSTDGKITSKFTLAKNSAGGYNLKGKGTEAETEGGKTERYAVIMGGRINLQAPGSISGTINVFEARTAP